MNQAMNAAFRQQFPALSRHYRDHALVYLDGPAGTQVPKAVIDAVAHYYAHYNANSHGAFLTSHETDVMVEQTRQRIADFLGAENAATISLGANMTTLNFALSRGIGRMLRAGDEVLITQLDHEGNRGPWLALRELGIIVREVKLLPSGQLDYADMEAKLTERTRLVAVGYASNILGTVNDLQKVRALTHAAGAWMLVDAVHAAPHLPIDVQAIGCDFLLCSAYKFYGPHVGILYSRPGLLDRIATDRLRTAGQAAPESIETGTMNFAAIAGVKAAIEFIGNQFGTGESWRERLTSAMLKIQAHERTLVTRLYEGLTAIPGVSVLGPSVKEPLRAPTLAIVVDGKRPEWVCARLNEQAIFAWDGHFYALRAVEILGLREKGGVTRMGISAYTTAEEVNRVIHEMEKIAG
ncbi:MAG: cysteine desulfurase-like protein [Lewinellaceae bacterium]|nr:cysteine desulfurase-like protein [Lewinellaceae bacterium]